MYSHLSDTKYHENYPFMCFENHGSERRRNEVNEKCYKNDPDKTIKHTKSRPVNVVFQMSSRRWYWARTRDKASHDPKPIPLGYRSHLKCAEAGRFSKIPMTICYQNDRDHYRDVRSKSSVIKDTSHKGADGRQVCHGSMFPNATQGLLETDHVSFNHVQVTWTTPEQAHLSFWHPNFEPSGDVEDTNNPLL
ncbi:hypothetical protein TNCV_3151011 [Trichonephila clavipes]|nr:hypothetical protein TNCV_3151011 [Trichonephila clavipes]